MVKQLIDKMAADDNPYSDIATTLRNLVLAGADLEHVPDDYDYASNNKRLYELTVPMSILYEWLTFGSLD